jgi:hypothetical protein
MCAAAGLPAVSAPPGARLPDASMLAITADKLLQQLTEMLKVPAVQQLPGPVVICAIKACGTVALQRPHLVGKVLPAMLALASKVRRRRPGGGGTRPPGGVGGHATSQYCRGPLVPAAGYTAVMVDKGCVPLNGCVCHPSAWILKEDAPTTRAFPSRRSRCRSNQLAPASQ